MKDLSCYEGVSLYDIGVSAEGRAIYALEVDVPSSKKKSTVVLTGSIHSRETAGTVFLLKELAELLSAGTRESKEVLATTRFRIVEAVPGFRTMTFEIGYGCKYLGYSYETRKLLADEYYSHHFDRVLYEVAKYCQGVR